MLKLFAPIGTIFGWLMYNINLVINNYGITLIVFTFIMKVLMVPLGISQQKSMIKNVSLQPKMNRLQKMYGNNREKYSEELQKLYKDEKVSPMSSCLNTLIMFPIIFGMLDVIYEPLKHMLKLSSDVIEAATPIATELLGGKLSSYSPQISILTAAKANPEAFINAPGVGAEVTALMQNFDFTFFGLPLTETPTIKFEGKSFGLWFALILIPILSGLSAYLMGKLNQAASLTQDGTAGKMAKSMFLTMPLLSIWISFIVPAGVGLYWLFSNVFSLIQQIVLNKFMNPAEEIEKAKIAMEEEKKAEREAKIEARKKAKVEAIEAKKEDAEAEQTNKDKLAAARKRMAEKYGDTSADTSEGGNQ